LKTFHCPSCKLPLNFNVSLDDLDSEQPITAAAFKLDAIGLHIECGNWFRVTATGLLPHTLSLEEIEEVMKQTGVQWPSC
jgi:hypothetical protein